MLPKELHGHILVRSTKNVSVENCLESARSSLVFVTMGSNHCPQLASGNYRSILAHGSLSDCRGLRMIIAVSKVALHNIETGLYHLTA